MNVYELMDEFKWLERSAEDAPDDTALKQRLAESEAKLTDKIENIGLYIRNLEAQVDGLKRAEASLKERREVSENQIRRMRELILWAMSQTGEKKVVGKMLQFWTGLSQPAVVIAPGAVVPPEYLITKADVSVDKEKLKNDLLAGVVVEGASIRIGTKLTIK